MEEGAPADGIEAAEPAGAEDFLRGGLDAEVFDVGDAGGVDPGEEVFLIGIGIEGGEGLVADYAVLFNPEDLLHAGDAGLAGCPDPVDKEVGDALGFDLVCLPSVPVVGTEDAVDDVLIREEPEIVGVDVSVTVLVVAYRAPSADGDSFVCGSATVGGVVAETAFVGEDEGGEDGYFCHGSVNS